MKRALVCGLILGILGAQAETPKVARPLKVLTIGNSFSVKMVSAMPPVAKSLGLKLDICSLYIGGCSLERHWTNVQNSASAPYSVTWNYGGVANGTNAPVARVVRAKRAANIPEVLTADRWDIVTVQQASHFSWQAATYAPWGDNLVSYIREHAPQARIYVQETWSYTPWDGRLKKWKISQDQMYARLHEAYAGFAARNKLTIIPTGTAVQLFRRELPVAYTENSFGGDPCGSATFVQNAKTGRWKPKGDVFHMNRTGDYLQALVWTAKLFGADVTACRYAPNEVTADVAALMKKVAMEAVGK